MRNDEFVERGTWTVERHLSQAAAPRQQTFVDSRGVGNPLGMCRIMMSGCECILAVAALVGMAACDTGSESIDPFLDVQSPNGGEVVARGETVSITYEHAGTDWVRWRLTKGGVLVQEGPNQAATGETIDAMVDPLSPVGTDYRVVLLGESVADSSDGFITVVDAPSSTCRNEPVSGVLMPMAVGNRWDHVHLRGGSEIRTMRTELSGEVAVTVDGQDFKTFQRRVYPIGALPFETQYLHGNESGGVYAYGATAHGDTFALRELKFPYPAATGSQSTITRYSHSSEGGTTWVIHDTLEVELVAIDEPVVTPAGVFEAHVYHYFNPPPPDVTLGEDIFDYYAPGIGHVAQIWRDEISGGIENEYLLVDYCLNRVG